MQDRQYKTLAIINTGGTVQERYSYTPYGKTFVYDSIFTVRTASAFDWVYLYTGRRFDRETGLYYFRNRYYDSSLGRFCSRDPITYFDGMNRYGNYFVLNAMDPSGLSWYGSLGRGIVQGVIGGVIVVGVATLAVTLGAPIAVVTIGIGVVGVVGAAILVADTIQDPSVDNIAENAGILIGGAIVGGIAGRPLACRLSPLGNQPPPGRLPSLVHEIAQGMEIRPGSSVLEQLIFVNGQGPTTGGAEGAITGGAGIIDLAK
jgi:RHS repeat-associated protein